MREEIVNLILEHATKAQKNNLDITIVSTSNYCGITKATAKSYLFNLTIKKELKMIETGENENYKYRSWRLNIK